MKILIAGNTGIIGSYLCSKETFKNASIINSSIVDLSSEKRTYEFAKTAKKINVLIYLVGLAHSKGRKNNYNIFKMINYNTLKNLLDAFKHFDKIPDKIVFASTISVYGERLKNNSYDESTVLRPYSPYAKTKMIAENYLLNNFASRSWILRFAPVYSDNFKLNIFRRIYLFKKYFRVGDGTIKLSLCNINNIYESINGIILGKVPPGVYNISDKNLYTYNDLLNSQNVKLFINVPLVLIKILYHLSKIIGNNFLMENSIKLISDNIYPNKKINKLIELRYALEDLDRK